MLTEICQYLKNWFERDRITGTFTVEGREITAASASLPDFLQEGQYYRVIGSVFNDGVHKYGDELTDEKAFDGAVVSMGVPPALVALSAEIEAWQAKYGGVDSSAMSPFASESESVGSWSRSFSKGGASGGSSGAVITWQSVFSARLAPWRKI